MKARYLLGAIALALSVGSAKPMIVTFDGQTGKCLEQKIYDYSQVSLGDAACLWHASQLSELRNARVIVLQQPVHRGENLVVDISW
jgi:hypothetical protein